MTEQKEIKSQSDDATYGPASPELYGLESERIRQTSGILGLLFGDASNAPTNIAGLVMLLIFVFGGVILLYPSAIPLPEYLKISTPIITLILGYLFGKKS
ncbi:hypothetical protein [Undibacterium sp. Ji49W]|uniref:hypothetical protein n=1 Tax=Undibacterium sp. Ji49W TaxID=3413040 RepID=UPI003BF35C6C